LLKSGVGQLEDINDGNESTVILYDRQIEIMADCEQGG
jgi:hypothetical protein